MLITIDTTQALSDTDISVLQLLTSSSPVADDTPPPAAVKPAPRKRAAAKSAPAPAPTPEKEPSAPSAPSAPSPDEAPEDEDLVGGEAPTLADAVAKATTFIQTGRSAKVKDALAEVGAKTVKTIKDDQVSAFLVALDG